VLRHKTFTSGWQLKWSETAIVEGVRSQAEAFASLIGARNVVSVTEYWMRSYNLTIWYLDETVKEPLDL
jgi:hypothetical protein